MARRSFGLIALVMLALAVTAPAWAGGWAVVTLDSLPGEVRASEDVRLGFMVLQHGVTPVGDFVSPYLLASNAETGEEVRVDARQDGPAGHFVVDVSFPSAGTWEWTITPDPFMGTQFEPLTVGAVSVASAAASSLGIRALQPTTLRWALGSAGVVMLIVAAALVFTRQRRPLGSWFALRSR